MACGCNKKLGKSTPVSGAAAGTQYCVGETCFQYAWEARQFARKNNLPAPTRR